MHAEGGRVHEQPRVFKETGHVIPCRRFNSTSKRLTHGFSLSDRPVDHVDVRNPALQQGMDDRTASPAGAQNQSIIDLVAPSGCGHVEGGHIAVAIRIGGTQHSVI